MVNNELSKAATEVSVILSNMSKDVLDKIPQNFKEFIIEISSKDYKFEYDEKLSLSEQKLLPKTQGILAIIYIKYLCDESEKEDFYKEYNKFLKLKEQQEEKYGFEDVFENKKE